MEFLRRWARAHPERPRVALVPGSYNPPTIAHQALLEAALQQVDEAVAVLPRAFPHKSYADGVTLRERVRMLAVMSPERYSIAIAEGGLFIEMYEEFRSAVGPQADVFIVCGRDAAERILAWDYTDAQALGRMFESFQLLVAARQGEFAPPEKFGDRMHTLQVPAACDLVSSTEVRQRISNGLPWRHLVPEAVAALAEEFYKR